MIYPSKFSMVVGSTDFEEGWWFKLHKVRFKDTYRIQTTKIYYENYDAVQ